LHWSQARFAARATDAVMAVDATLISGRRVDGVHQNAQENAEISVSLHLRGPGFEKSANHLVMIRFAEVVSRLWLTVHGKPPLR
jgi:hypothetical protein